MIDIANAKGILFSTAMVKAIQEKHKTQTRRVCKASERWVKKFELPKPRYEIGDILYVRETWAPCATIDSWLDDKNLYVYKANFPDDCKPDWKWRPSIFMPKEAARLWLEVTDARAERVQDITEQDAVREGVPIGWPMDAVYCPICRGLRVIGSARYLTVECPHCNTSVKRFRNLWDSINAKPKPVHRTINGRKHITHYESYPWDDVRETWEHRGKELRVYGNPWVWVYSFRDVSGEAEA